MNTVRISDYRNYKISDSDVVRRVLAGEKELYEILMRRHNQTLFRVIRGYIKDEEEVQDLMQETYLKAYLRLYQFNNEAKFSTWLIRIGINEALAKIRSEHSANHPTNPDEENTSKIKAELADPSANPERKMIQKEAVRILEQSIDQLSSTYRSVYIMREIEGLSIKEIADALHLSEANVKVRIHRAKKMIKDELYHSTKSENLFEFGFRKCDKVVNSVMEKIF